MEEFKFLLSLFMNEGKVETEWQVCVWNESVLGNLDIWELKEEALLSSLKGISVWSILHGPSFRGTAVKPDCTGQIIYSHDITLLETASRSTKRGLWHETEKKGGHASCLPVWWAVDWLNDNVLQISHFDLRELRISCWMSDLTLSFMLCLLKVLCSNMQTATAVTPWSPWAADGRWLSSCRYYLVWWCKPTVSHQPLWSPSEREMHGDCRCPLCSECFYTAFIESGHVWALMRRFHISA